MSKLAITLAILSVAMLHLMLAASTDSLARVSSTSICTIDVNAETELMCPVTCFKPDPVCGADGLTYWYGSAEVRCAGASAVEPQAVVERSRAPKNQRAQEQVL